MIYVRILSDFLLFFFSLCVISSTFSIAVSQLTLGVSVLLFLIIIIIKKEFPYYAELKWFYKIVGLFIVWMIISSLFSSTPFKSLMALKDEWLFLIIPIGIFLTVKLKSRQNIIAVFSSIIILISIYGVAQFFTGINFFSNDVMLKAPMYGYRISGFSSFGVTLGNFFSVAGIFLATYALFGYASFPKRRFLLFLISGLSAMLMAVLTFSRAPILAIVLVTILVVILMGKRWWKQGLVFTIVLLGLLAFLPGIQERFVNEFDKEYSGVYEGGRVYIWKNSLKLIADNPLFGVGVGNFKESYATYIPSEALENRKVSSAHNDFIDIAANTGIPGFVLYVLLWLSVLGCFWKKYHNDKNISIEQKAILLAVICGSVCFGIISMFHGVFVDDEVRQVLLFLWALGFAVTVSSARNSTSDNLPTKSLQNCYKYHGTK